MAVLLDSGFLYATLNRKKSRHTITCDIISEEREDIVLPLPAVTEVAYLLKRDLGVEVAADFIESLTTSPLLLA